MEVDRSLDPNPNITGARPALARGTHGIPTREGAATTVTGQLPLAPSFEWADTSRGDSVAR